MKKILVVATAMVAGLAVGIAQAEDEKGKGKGKGKGGDPAKRAEMMVQKLDKDGNGTLSKEEFAASPMAKKAQEAGKGRHGRQNVRRVVIRTPMVNLTRRNSVLLAKVARESPAVIREKAKESQSLTAIKRRKLSKLSILLSQ